ncbi:unnamed protein product, partial [Darwinula stevensoni]
MMLVNSTSAGNLRKQNVEYLQRSKIPTMHFQKSLPHLAIPKLEDTMKRYLAAQKPLLDDKLYAETEKLVNEFLHGIGPQLQKEILSRDKRNKGTSYISPIWFDMYLKDHRPVVLTHNPFMAFVDETRPAYKTPVVRATNMVISSLRFRRSLVEGVLEPDVFHLIPKKSDTPLFRTLCALTPSPLSWYTAYSFKAFPLDMSQYKNLLNSTRIPEHGKDRLMADPSGRHLLVMRNGHFYVFDVIEESGDMLQPEKVLACLDFISTDPRSAKAPDIPLGILTSANRDIWADLRQYLVGHLGNGDTFKKIDSALYCLTFDDMQGDDPELVFHNFLHGDGKNRWYDKSLSLHFTKDGRAAVNFEHAWGDGVAVLRFFNEIFIDSTKKPMVSTDTPIKVQGFDPTRHVTRLVLGGVRGLEVLYTEGPPSLLFPNTASYESSSETSLLESGGKVVGTYESCSTAAYKHGRTETLRPATIETKRCCEAFANRTHHTPVSDLRKLLESCSNKHGQLTREAAMGQGFDRHLLALRTLLEEKGEVNKAPLFLHPSYMRINHIILSTSTLSSPAVHMGGFAPVSLDGFGIGYGIRDSDLGCVVSSYPPHRDGDAFVSHLKSAYSAIQDVIHQLYHVFGGVQTNVDEATGQLQLSPRSEFPTIVPRVQGTRGSQLHLSASPSEDSSSFLWGVKRDPPSFFFGTIHVPYTRVWDYIPGNAKAAFAQSHAVFFELDLTDPQTMAALSHCQMLPRGESLANMLPRSLYVRIKRHLAYVRGKLPQWLGEESGSGSPTRHGLYADYLFKAIAGNWERKRPVWVMLMLNALTEGDVRSRGIPVLDLYLAHEAERLNKETGAVERVQEQCLPLNRLHLDQVPIPLCTFIFSSREALRRNRERC